MPIYLYGIPLGRCVSSPSPCMLSCIILYYTVIRNWCAPLVTCGDVALLTSSLMLTVDLQLHRDIHGSEISRCQCVSKIST